MLIAVISDIHDRLDNLERVLEDINRHAPEMLIFCGDLSKNSTLLYLAELFPKEIHLVLGNTDSEDDIKQTIDRERLLKVYYHQLFGRLTVGAEKRHVAFTHKPRDAESLLQTGFDIVFYGHTHEAKTERPAESPDTQLVNPGDIQGRFGRKPSYVLYETETNVAGLHTVD